MFNKEIMQYIGDISQIGGIKRYNFSEGKAKGVGALDVNNGSGLVFTVVADRGIDIYQLSFKGIPISFISKTGIVSPYFYNDRSYEWLRSFGGGFLTTCGLTQVGEPCSFEGQEYGLHGQYSNIPADKVSVFSDWCDDKYVIEISGEVRQAKVQFENLVLKRKIRTLLGVDELTVEDVIINEGSKEEPFMILYHMNFGYPFLNPYTDIRIPSKSIKGWDEYSQSNIERCMEIDEPQPEAHELTFYHDACCDSTGFTRFLVTNNVKNSDIGVLVEYDKKVLNNLVQWKYLQKKDYVMAIEPCNNLVKGVDYENRHGKLKFLKPGEEVRIKLTFRFLSLKEEIEREKANIKALI